MCLKRFEDVEEKVRRGLESGEMRFWKVLRRESGEWQSLMQRCMWPGEGEWMVSDRGEEGVTAWEDEDGYSKGIHVYLGEEGRAGGGEFWVEVEVEEEDFVVAGRGPSGGAEQALFRKVRVVRYPEVPETRTFCVRREYTVTEYEYAEVEMEVKYDKDGEEIEIEEDEVVERAEDEGNWEYETGGYRELEDVEVEEV